jgi:hypothetical protein
MKWVRAILVAALIFLATMDIVAKLWMLIIRHEEEQTPVIWIH